MPDTYRPPASRAEFRSALIDLVAHGLSSRRRRPEPVRVDGGTPLFETGLVDSLAILELIAFVEEATGRPIPARQVHLKHFGTVDRICDAFWAGGDPKARDSASHPRPERRAYDPGSAATPGPAPVGTAFSPGVAELTKGENK